MEFSNILCVIIHESVLFLTDILPTGWQGAEHCEIQGGETIAIWGAGPVGLFAIQSAKIMGAGRIIAIETVPERIALAEKVGATDVTAQICLTLIGSGAFTATLSAAASSPASINIYETGAAADHSWAGTLV